MITDKHKFVSMIARCNVCANLISKHTGNDCIIVVRCTPEPISMDSVVNEQTEDYGCTYFRKKETTK